MYVHPRKDRQGQIYYSFSYLNADGKRVRLKKSEHPHFTYRDEADAWAKSQAGIRASKKAYIERKMSWRSKYLNFEEMLELYASWQKPKAPNSWKSSVYYLEQWAFPFFLQEKKLGNINDWHLYFQEFSDWLQGDAAAMKKGRTSALAASTVNNIVKALNTFLSCMNAYNKIDPDSVKKVPALPDHKLAHRTYQDVIDQGEMLKVYGQMKLIDPTAAEFFYVLWHTGMRFSELFGLSITGIFRGPMGNKSIDDELAQKGISYLGYIYLDSQPFYDDCKREDDKSLRRKPLKSCHSIGPKYARMIPIRTKEVWNILATRYKAQLEEFAKKTYTGSKTDYILFDDLEWNRAVNTLKKAYIKLGIEPKSYHCCRHSFTTLLVGETRSFFLVRAITGHRKDKSFERYLHIYEQIALDAKNAEQEIDVI